MVPNYIVETYVPQGREEVDRAAARARDAAESLTGEGTAIRFLRSTFVPADELCFFVFEAESSEVVGEATARAAIAVERIVEAVE